MNRRSEYRAWMAAIAVVGASGVVSSLVPIVEHVIGAALIAAGLLRGAVVVVRRERRIRTRLADPRTRPLAQQSAAAALTRVGPGDPAPVSPAPTARPGATWAATSTGGAQ